MFIAMNRFKIKKGKEQAFIDLWKKRESYLDEVSGFKEFHLLQGIGNEDHTLFASHSIWETEDDFENWTKSDAFRKAHEHAGEKARDIYLGPPNLECFNAVI